MCMYDVCIGVCRGRLVRVWCIHPSAYSMQGICMSMYVFVGVRICVNTVYQVCMRYIYVYEYACRIYDACTGIHTHVCVYNGMHHHGCGVAGVCMIYMSMHEYVGICMCAGMYEHVWVCRICRAMLGYIVACMGFVGVRMRYVGYVWLCMDIYICAYVSICGM